MCLRAFETAENGETRTLRKTSDEKDFSRSHCQYHCVGTAVRKAWQTQTTNHGRNRRAKDCKGLLVSVAVAKVTSLHTVIEVMSNLTTLPPALARVSLAMWGP